MCKFFWETVVGALVILLLSFMFVSFLELCIGCSGIPWPTAENLCTEQCRQTFPEAERDKKEIFGVPKNKYGTMREGLICKCYTRTRKNAR
jgi:hypothetical protein